MKKPPPKLEWETASSTVVPRMLPAWLGEFQITDSDFRRFRELVLRHTGISLAPHKREMLKARLGRRLRALGLTNFSDYYRYLSERDASGEELGRMINAVTTNVTEFFREDHHFKFMAKTWITAMQRDPRRSRMLRIWSAGCSTGEEPYTIAMVLREALGAALSSWDIRILASDIDTEALARAQAGVYSREKIGSIPEAMLRRHFLCGAGADAGLVRIRPEVQALVTFRRLNLLDDPWPIRTCFDAIFCRNVMIYFDRPTQQHLMKRLSAFLHDDGVLFLGHSEGLNGMTAGLTHRQNTIYQRTAADPLVGGGPAACRVDQLKG